MLSIANATSAATFNGTLTATKYFVSALNTAPSSASDTGITGEIKYGYSGGVYYQFLCIATNTWVRRAFETW